MSWAKARLILDATSFRHTATVAFLCLMVALLSIMGSGSVLDSLTRSHVRTMILQEAQSIYHLARTPDSRTVARIVRDREANSALRDRHAVVLGPDGTLLQGDPAVAALLPRHVCADQPCWKTLDLEPRSGFTYTIFGALFSTADNGLYFNAYNLNPMLERTLVIPLIAGTSLLTALIGSLALSLRHSLRTLTRIDAIRGTMRSFGSGTDRPAYNYVGPGDEIDLLQGEVNSNLRRIDHLMEETRSVIDYLAHQMRTPLTRLKNQIISASEKAEGAARKDLEDAAEETERIHELLRTVMGLSEIESGRCTHDLGPVDGRLLLEDLRDYYLPLAEERGIPLRLSIDGDATLIGDEPLLFQALANMLDNALKYAPPNRPITLYVHDHGPSRDIGVSDHGPGIPENQRERATVRFQRLHKSSGIAGHGLGLAFVRAIAELHGSRMVMADNAPGLRIGLRFPIPAF